MLGHSFFSRIGFGKTRKQNSTGHRTIGKRSCCSRPSTRGLRLEPLEERQMLAIVSWDGGAGDLLWSSAENWGGDVLPGTGDDVVIDAAGDVTIVHDSGATEVASLTSEDSIQITGGGLAVLGSFEMTAGRSLTVENDGVSFQADGATIVDGVSLCANGGGTIDLPGVREVTNTSRNVYWQATGAGSALRAENLERITGATVYSAARVFIEALEGAEVDLSNVTDIVVTQSSSRWRSVEVKAEGNGSVVGLNNLQTFYDEWGNGEGAYSRLDATNGAAINLGNLTNVSGVLLPMDGTGTLNTSTITSFDDCRLEASGAAVDFE